MTTVTTRKERHGWDSQCPSSSARCGKLWKGGRRRRRVDRKACNRLHVLCVFVFVSKGKAVVDEKRCPAEYAQPRSADVILIDRAHQAVFSTLWIFFPCRPCTHLAHVLAVEYGMIEASWSIRLVSSHQSDLVDRVALPVYPSGASFSAQVQ